MIRKSECKTLRDRLLYIVQEFGSGSYNNSFVAQAVQDALKLLDQTHARHGLDGYTDEELIDCAGCQLTVKVKPDAEGQVTCPECDSTYPLHYAKAVMARGHK